MSNIDTIKVYGDWLGKTDWDYFSNFTYRFDINQRQNERLMNGLRKNLESTDLNHFIFYVTEFTNYSYNTHNHMLIKGEGVKDRVESYFRDKKLLYDNILIILMRRA